jgi:aspartyl-tRNA(Asn)/glutamyl-tRNA(Gln) amidotransferase subunit C
MAKLTKEQVLKIADLIKLHLSDDELSHYQDQLNTVLESVDVLKELDTSKVAETSQTHGLKNVLRKDEPSKGLDISKYPNKDNLKNGYFIVKRVIS